jgi:kynurenine formamidase
VKIVDLSRELHNRAPNYPGHSAIIHGMWKTHEESFADGGNVHGLASMYFAMPDHGGTHIDAPLHFDKRGEGIDQYPLEKCIVPGICIDLPPSRSQVIQYRRAARYCSAPAITSELSRARNTPRKIPA